MAVPGRTLMHNLLQRSSLAFVGLVVTLLVASWVLIQDGTHGLRQAALTAATQSAARAALALKDEMHAVEGRLLAIQREARPLAGIAHAPLPAEVTAGVAGAEPGELRLATLPGTTDVLAFLVPALPGAATPAQRLPRAALQALLVPLPGTALRLITGLGTELLSTGSGGDVQTSLWVREGVLRVDGTAAPATMSLVVWLIPLFGLGTLGFIFSKHLQRSERTALKLTALRGNLARHAAQLNVNEARMRLSQTERAAAGQREVALVEAWPGPVALTDPEGRLVAWSASFEAMLPEGVLRRDLPLGMLTRHLDPRAAATDNGRRAPGNRPRVRATTLPDGSRLFAGLEDAAPTDLGEIRHLCRATLEAILPRLREAVTAGAAGEARLQAHAMRGLAANFGLKALVPALEELERVTLVEPDRLPAKFAEFIPVFEAAMQELGSPAV